MNAKLNLLSKHLSNIKNDEELKIIHYFNPIFHKLTKHYIKQNIAFGMIEIDIKDILIKKKAVYDVNYWEDNKLYELDLPYFIEMCRENKQDIFIPIDYTNYALFDDDISYTKSSKNVNDDNVIQTHHYGHHRVCLFFKYNKCNDNYNLYYINQHGIGIQEYHFYYKIFSKRRAKYLDLNEPIEKIVIHKMVTYMNDIIEETIVNWKWNSKHVYLGPNFQEEDDIGMCYFMPFIIHKLFLSNIRNGKNTNITTFISYNFTKFLSLIFKMNLLKNRQTIESTLGSKKYIYKYSKYIIGKYQNWIEQF